MLRYKESEDFKFKIYDSLQKMMQTDLCEVQMILIFCLFFLERSEIK